MKFYDGIDGKCFYILICFCLLQRNYSRNLNFFSMKVLTIPPEDHIARISVEN